MPRFTIVICTYERPRLLKRAIRSVLSQTFEDFELLIVDDGSKEGGVAEVLSHFSDERIRFSQNATNRGLGYSSNIAFSQAKGEFITTLGDDDEYLPEFLERTASHLDSTGVAFCWCGIREYFEHREPRETVVILPSLDRVQRQMVAARIGSGYGFTFRKDCLDHVGGFDEDLVACLDLDFFLKLVQGPWEWAGLPEILVKVHRVPKRLTANDLKRSKSLATVLLKHDEFLNSPLALNSNLHHALGVGLVEQGERLWARRVLWSWVRRSPNETRFWVPLISNELRYSWLGRKLLSIYRWSLQRWLSFG